MPLANIKITIIILSLIIKAPKAINKPLILIAIASKAAVLDRAFWNFDQLPPAAAKESARTALSITPVEKSPWRAW